MALLKYTKLFAVCTLVLVGRNQAKPPTEHAEGGLHGVFKEIEELKMEVGELRKSYQTISRNFSQLQLPSQKDTGPDDVYFSTLLSHDAHGIAVGEKIVYGNAFNNGGGAYDNTTGVFTVPTDGVYLFSLSCNSLKAQASILGLMFNGRFQMNCYVEPSYDGEDESSSALIVDRMYIGNRVWVEAYYSDNTLLDLKKFLNTFSGVLIHR